LLEDVNGLELAFELHFEELERSPDVMHPVARNAAAAARTTSRRMV
jgi:hypothetical protein